MVGNMKNLTSVSVIALLASVNVATAQEDTQVDIAPIDEIVVRGVNIPDEKRATSEISAVLDEAAFERQGDSNIADALKRVTGLSLSDGKFVIVRGLNERYSSSTLNGSPLPSPEPLRRVAPLDLFPTSILSGSLVQKTFSPEYSAEFGGGAIDLRIKGLPEEGFFEVGIGAELDTVSSIKKGLTYDGGNRDWLGLDDGTRDVPTGLEPFFNTTQLTGQLTEAEQNALDVSVNNSETLLLFETDTPPSYDVRVSGGTRWDTSDDVSIGFVATAGFDTEFVTREGERRRNTAVNPDNTFDSNQGVSLSVLSTQQNVQTNGLFSVGAELFDNHEITATGLILRSTTKEARIEQGVNNDRNSIRNDFTEFFERQVWQAQANGEHVFPSIADISMNWRFAYGEAFRDSPYERRVSYLFDANGDLFYDFTGQQNDISTIRFTRLDDENLGGGIDFVLPLVIAENGVDVKFGYAYTDKERTTFDRRYQYFADAAIPELAGSRIDVIYSDAVLGTGLIDIRQAGVGLGNPDNFQGGLEVHAAYVGLDAELGPYIRVAAGGRFESSEQTTQTSVTGNANSLVNFAPIDEEYFLPAVTVTWNPIDDVQVRAGFSQTITRPQFRELAPVFFTNPDTDIPTFGNPNLVNSEINNFDARVEYYFARGEYVTIGGFYKDITNPIEEINSSGFAGGDQGGTSFVNAPEAELYGLEFEFQKNFAIDQWFDSGWLGGWASTKELVFISNYTFSKSDVTGGPALVTQFLGNGTPITTSATITGDRSLQGQSDHLANVQIGYEDYEANSRATFLFNYASDRIQQIEGGAPNNRVVEDPPIQLDFVYSRDIEIAGGIYELGMKIGNILGDEYNASQVTTDGNDEIVDTIVYDRYDVGRTFGISLKRTF